MEEHPTTEELMDSVEGLEAKDTVMTVLQLWDAYKKQPDKYEVIAAIEEQAEISFKAGEDKGKQEGFDKVVEWMMQERIEHEGQKLANSFEEVFYHYHQHKDILIGKPSSKRGGNDFRVYDRFSRKA